MKNPRVWFKSISLENVRSFGTKQTISFTDKDGNAARWNVILGDNGTGKTTVLKGLFFSHQVLMTGNQSNFPDIHSLKRGDFINPESRKLTSLQLTYFIENALEKTIAVELKDNVQEQGGVKLSCIEGDFIGSTRSLLSKKPLVQGFGASRRTDEERSQQTGNQALTLFNDNISLIGAETWLQQAEYISLKDKKYEGYYLKVKEILLDILKGEVSDIFTSIDFGVTPVVYFKTNYGAVRQRDLSLGYKTLIAWMVDFAKGLFDRYPESDDPLSEPAVCLVDEIDLHLHPKFQRTIIKFLTETFTNTQFIVTAHSPLIVVAAEERPLDANIILLKREGDQTVVVNDPVDVSKWSVDQILNSDLFGHVPARSEPLTELRTERDALLAKQKLTTRQQTRLSELDDQIGFLPFGRDQAEVQAETIIQQLANVLRSKQQEQ